MATWIYKQTEPMLWTVGFYSPDGRWHADSDHSSREDAAKRVHYLNGGVELKEETECDRNARPGAISLNGGNHERETDYHEH